MRGRLITEMCDLCNLRIREKRARKESDELKEKKEKKAKKIALLNATVCEGKAEMLEGEGGISGNQYTLGQKEKAPE